MKVTRIVTGFLAVALLTIVVGDAFGQDEGRRGRPEDGGGRGGQGGGDRGGFGGGRGGQGGGFGGGPGGGPGGGVSGPTQDPSFGLLRIQEVREEIELLPDQEEALTKMNEQAEANRQRPDFDFRNASEQDRTAFFEKMQKEFKERAEVMQAQLEEILLPEQMDRLKQLGVQAMGVRALTNEEVAKKLEITPKQKEELDAVSSKVREQMMELFRSGDRDSMREKMEEMRKSIESDALNVLTADQKKEFEELKGEPFKFPEGAIGRGGPGGGPGGDRGGPGGDRGDRGGPGGDRGGPGGDRGGPGGDRGTRQRPTSE